jgi:hypothetical protein
MLRYFGRTVDPAAVLPCPAGGACRRRGGGGNFSAAAFRPARHPAAAAAAAAGMARCLKRMPTAMPPYCNMMMIDDE